MDYTLEAEFYATDGSVRSGHVSDIRVGTSTICCGWNFGTVAEVQAHRTNH